jgi:hypothetical protein
MAAGQGRHPRSEYEEGADVGLRGLHENTAVLEEGSEGAVKTAACRKAPAGETNRRTAD